MRAATSMMRLSSLFLKRITTYKYSKANRVALTSAGFGLGYAFWVGQQKIFSEQLITVETNNDLKQGEVREIQVGPKIEDTILVIKYEGQIYSLQSKCAHFGFPLAKGLLIGDKILCPLHNAGFSIKTGQSEQGPVFGGLKTFKVSIRDDKIIINIPKTEWSTPPTRKQLGEENVDKTKRVVIVGSGPTALSAINTLRDAGFKGEIIMVSKDTDLPYDRTMLSKSMTGKNPNPIRNSESLTRDGVSFKGGVTVNKIDYDKKKIILDNKEAIGYDKLLLATGCRNRVPPIPGLSQVQYQGLRNLSDYEKINQALRKDGVKNVTIIGAGFIGMEVAAAIKAQFKEQINISVIEKMSAPLQLSIGKDIGNVLKTLAAKNNVNLITGTGVKKIKGKDGKPEFVVLDNSEVPTDVLIVATGVQPVVDYAQDLIDPTNHGIKTNAYLETNKKGVYAAGDIASYPYWYTGKQNRIQHYNQAIYQGSVAGLNIAGKKYPMDNIPFFWTRQYNNSLLVTGIINGWDDIHITGSLEQMKFVAYYIDSKSDLILGAAVMNIPNQIQIINEAMRNGVMPKASEVKQGKISLQQVLKQLRQKNPQCSKCTTCTH